MKYEIPGPLRCAVSKFAAHAICALLLVSFGAGSSTQAVASDLRTGDVVVSHNASGIEFRLVTESGIAAFALPDGDWPVIAMQSMPPISVAAFQIPNHADDGNPDSTNVAVSNYHLDTDRGRDALRKWATEHPAFRTGEAYGKWIIHSLGRARGATNYSMLDSEQEFPGNKIAVAVRIAWPHLKENAAGYDALMSTTYGRLLDSIYAKWGPYALLPGGVVRSPDAQH
ncbi:MAG: hypothetical protein ABSD74_01335 [Rhizomicrobium sp.]